MISGMTQAEAEEYATDNPMQLSLFYDIGRGGFAIDAEAVGNTLYTIFSGYRNSGRNNIERIMPSLPRHYSYIKLMIFGGGTHAPI